MEYAPPVLLQSKNDLEMLQITKNKALINKANHLQITP